MKRMGMFLLCALCLACLLAACGREEPEATDWTAAQMARAVWDSQGGTEEARAILFDSGDFASYVSDCYQIAPGSIREGAILYAGGVSAQEIAVLHLADADAADGAAAALQLYIDSRAGAFTGYAPEQAAILERSGTVGRGQYLALLICPDQQAARDAFAACFTSAPPEEDAMPDPPAPAALPEEDAPAPPPEPEAEGAETEDPDTPIIQPPEGPEEEDTPPEGPDPLPDPEPDGPPSQPEPEPEPEPQPVLPEGPWSYDQERIADAWRSGDRTGLWEQDLAILAVLDGIPALADEQMPDHERELALHDWMTGWAEYDPGALSNAPQGEPMPDNDNPYGFLTGKKGICLGYASTFQLLMDLCGIECRTVNGTSHAGTAEHAWNLVKLEGEWYAVDVTWDDPVASFPVPASTAHQYFNVTSAFLRQHDHQWDESAVPEAEGEALAWAP